MEGIKRQQLGDKPISRHEENVLLGVDENANVRSLKAIKSRRKLLSVTPKNRKRWSWSASCSVKVRLYLFICLLYVIIIIRPFFIA